MKPELILKRILYFSATKILVGIILISSAYNFISGFKGGVFRSDLLSNEWNKLISVFIAIIISILLYRVLYGAYEKRNISELNYQNLLKNISIGASIGFILQSLTILVIYLFGSYHIVSVNSALTFIIPPLIMALTSSVMEELIFRGIIFRIIEEKLGSYIALAVSSLFFGAIHMMNPDASLTGGISLALQAGLLLGVAYIYSRSLWLPIGLHFAWNFAQSAIYGAIVSGNKITESLIVPAISGNELITGGNFGPEGSIQATIFCLIAVLLFMNTSNVKNNIIKTVRKK